MNYALLWLEILLIGLLWVAASGALISRVEARWKRGWLWAIFILLQAEWSRERRRSVDSRTIAR